MKSPLWTRKDVLIAAAVVEQIVSIPASVSERANFLVEVAQVVMVDYEDLQIACTHARFRANKPAKKEKRSKKRRKSKC